MNVLFDQAAPHPDGFRDVDPPALQANVGRVRIIDVREPHEFVGELGHVPGAELVPKATVEAHAKDWDRGQEMVIVCRSGGRSAAVASVLARRGFTRVLNLRGGMLAYNAAGYPVDRTP